MMNVMTCLFQTGVQITGQLFLIQVLSDEDNLLHAVAVFLVPVTQQSRFFLHQLDQFFL